MVTLADARRIIAAAEQKATEIAQPMNIAVVDAGGNLVAHVRMDGAWMGSVDISIKKAWTSRAFDIETKALSKLAQPGEDFYGIHVPNRPDPRDVPATGIETGNASLGNPNNAAVRPDTFNSPNNP